MGSRIISIYCHHHLTEYWYDIDNRLKDKRNFVEAQICGNGIMQIKEDDIVYILCRYKDRVEIKYKCKVIETYIDSDEKDDPYEHNKRDFDVSYYFKAIFICAYEDGCFPLDKLRAMGLVSKHYQLNGDIVTKPLYDYIEQNKKVVKDF